MKFPIHYLAPRLSLALACLLSLPLGASAQEQPEDYSLTFSVYLWSEPHGRVLTTAGTIGPDGESRMGDYIPLTAGFIEKDGQLSDFKLTARTFSEPQEYKGPSPLVFATEQTGSTAESPLYHETGRVALSKNVEEAILFFFPKNDAAQTSFNISLLPSGPKDIPAGQALVVNLSGSPIAAKVGDQRVVLQPQGTQKLTLSGLVNNRLPVMLAAQEDDGQWQLKLQRNVSMINNTALLILLHENNGNYRIENIRLRR